MEVGSTVRTQYGIGRVRTIHARTVEVVIDGKPRWIPSDMVDQMYDPLDKIDRPDTHMQFVTGIDAHRLLTEYRFNPYVLASSTKIKIFPHQINEVIWGLDNPRIMIADEVGLGKTIIAALIVAEIRARGMAKRLLFVVPKSLQIKWKNELEQRFDISTIILDSEYLKSNSEPFGDEFSYVASIDYLKQDHIRDCLGEFDVVVIDEAHKMKIGTDRLRLGKHLSSRTNSMILLTATPHDGRDEDFMARIALLDPFAPDIRSASYLWTRTMKEDVVDMHGMSVFPGRSSYTVDVCLLNKERNILSLLENYFDHLQSKVKTPQEFNMIRFLQHIYRKRASSSFHSLEISLNRRLEKLGTASISVDNAISTLDSDEYIDFEDVEGFDGFTVLDIEEERNILREILSSLASLDHDSKLGKLAESIRAIKSEKPDAKVVVFSEYRDTLDYLAQSLDWETGRIDGTMTLHEREDSLNMFRDNQGSDVLLCTDAAGEGIDMQFCNIEINYDLPWNPNRLEQRMGRIHRIGQDQNVFYYNFIVDSQNSIDGYIMRKLLDKIEQIKKSMGDTVYDVIGMLVGEKDFEMYYDQLRKIPHDRWEPEVKAMLEQIEETIRSVEEKRKMLLEGNRLDSTSLDTIRNIRKTAVVIDEVRRFLYAFVESNDGKMDLLDRHKRIYKIRLSDRHAQELDVGEITGVFNADMGQRESYPYLALGNPNIDKILCKSASDHIASLGHENQEGVMCIYKISIIDNDSRHRDAKIVALFEQADGIINHVDERCVWEYKDSEKKINIDLLAGAAGRMNEYVSSIAKTRKSAVDNKLAKIQTNAVNTCNRYYASKMTDTNDRIDKLRQEIDPHLEKIIHDKEREIERMKRVATNERNRIKQRYLTRTEISLIGVAQITADDGADRRIRIDEAGMKAVIDAEKARAPDSKSKQFVEDCSKKNCGYDVESFDRKIEVKSHEKSGSVMLTNHEWETAARLRDEYWLYVVEYAFESPKITRIQNPVERFQNSVERMSSSQMRWVIHDWKN